MLLCQIRRLFRVYPRIAHYRVLAWGDRYVKKGLMFNEESVIPEDLQIWSQIIVQQQISIDNDHVFLFLKLCNQ